MPDFSSVTRGHVLQAVAEYDRLGAEEFLAAYGFGRAKEYVLRHEGRSYDSKAVLGVALKYAAGRAAGAEEFSGGKHGAAKVLGDLGFEVTSPEEPSSGEAVPAKEKPAKEKPATGAPVTGTWHEASQVGTNAAREAWSEAAREVLLDVARRYHSTVTYNELAEAAQHRSGIRARQPMRYWIGDVLHRVSKECRRRGEPLLSALCVNAEGSVGEGYAGKAVYEAYGAVPGDHDDHAAHERLTCHRHFGAPDLPADGGTPALTPKLAATRERARQRTTPQSTPPKTCPTCFLQLPTTGICDDCG